jgi:hypothetical protein
MQLKYEVKVYDENINLIAYTGFLSEARAKQYAEKLRSAKLKGVGKIKVVKPNT